jgi:hypothetical protein
MMKRHLVKGAVLVSLLVLVAVRGAMAGGLPQALDTIQQGIADVQGSVSSLTAPEQSSVRYTPPVLAPPHALIRCQAVNVTAVAQDVQVAIVRPGFGDRVSDQCPALGAGSVCVRGLIIEPAEEAGQYFCRFTVVNGVRTSIRAGLTLSLSDGTPAFAYAAE